MGPSVGSRIDSKRRIASSRAATGTAACALKWPLPRPIRGQGDDTLAAGRAMPTLFRFLMTIAVLAGIAYGTMFALVTFVEPRKGEMTVRIPADKLNPQN